MLSISIHILVVLSLAFACSASTIYATMTELSKDTLSTSMYTVSIDSSGHMTKVAEPNIIFLVNGGGSLGVSAFDQQRGLYYYAVDYNSATIFVTDVRGRVTQPPLDINVASVVELFFDDKTDRLFTVAWMSYSNQYILAQLGDSYRLVANLPPLANPHFNFRGAVDGDKGLIYVISQTWNATSTQSSIHTIDGESGTFLRTASVDSNCAAIPLRTWFDKATGQVWGMSATLSEGRAQFVKISPTTGRCNSTSLPDFEQGNFCAFDPSTNEVWCSVGFSDNNGMQKLQSYNTKTGKVSKPILWYTGYYYVMMNLAVSLKF